MLRRKYIATNAYIIKKRNAQNKKLNIPPEENRKSKHKGVKNNKVRVEFNETKNRKPQKKST